MAGWILLHRNLKEHWIWSADKGKEYTKAQAWIDMLFRAEYQDTKVVLENEIVIVPKGAFLATERELAEAWNWKSSTKARNFIKLLEKDGMISLNRKHRKSMIIVENYALYQVPKSKVERIPKAVRKQSESKAKVSTYYIKNIKNIKKLKNNARTREEEEKDFHVWW